MGSAYFDARSLWQRSEMPLYASLGTNLRVDTCIVGAGIAGLTTAYKLLKAGQKVAILERERLGLGETGLTSAHLSNALDEGYVAIRHLHGREGSRLAAESHTHGINFIEQIQREEGIACDFRRLSGYLFMGPEQNLSDLVDERDAACIAGLNVTLLEQATTRLFKTGPCLHFPNQAQLHPLRYLDGLASAVRRLGGKIYTHTEASEVVGGHYAYVKTSQGFKVEAENIVVATNVPFNNLVTIHSKNAPYRSYVIGVPLPADAVAQGFADAALFWDMARPYHYLRLVKDPTTLEMLLLVGGEDHRTGHDTDPEIHFKNLERWIAERLDITARTVTRWSGQVIEPIDGLAFIGRNPGDEENVYIITGDSGHGLTHGSLGGILLSDMILRRPNPWESLYDPARLHLHSLATYFKEATQSTIPYGDWLASGSVKSTEQIPAGEGAVIREGIRPIAVYKDEGHRLHSCSAVCTHLGGIVRWNRAEKTWDCPCHGSRYDRFGEVVNGPAVAALGPAHDPREPDAETEPWRQLLSRGMTGFDMESM